LLRFDYDIKSLSDSYKDSIGSVRHNRDEITGDDGKRMIVDRNHEGAVHRCVDEAQTISLPMLNSSVEVLALSSVRANVHTVHEAGIGLWRDTACQRVIEKGGLLIPVRQCEGAKIFIVVVCSRAINDECTESSYTILDTYHDLAPTKRWGVRRLTPMTVIPTGSILSAMEPVCAGCSWCNWTFGY
jgi:hypothetical protein